MIRKKIALALVLSLLTSVFVAAQTADKPDSAKAEEKKAREETEKKALVLVDEVIKEAQSLRLPENRIRMQAIAANLLWKRDERRARALFKQATDGVKEMMVQAGSPLGPYNVQIVLSMQTREQIKQEVLQLLAQNDPKLAREFLRSVRNPAQEQEANNQPYAVDDGQELRLASQIAATDPEQALQIAEESISRGLNMELINVFNQIASKDREMGNKLLTALMKNLRSANISENDTAASFAFSLLRFGVTGTFDNDDDDGDEEEVTTAPKPATTGAKVMDERVIKELMEMVTAFALKSTTPSKADEEEDEDEIGPYLIMELNSMIKEVEKYAPSSASQIKRRFAEYTKKLAPEEKIYLEQQDVLTKGTADQILETAGKVSDDMRDSFYAQAAMKAFGEGDETRARQILTDHIPNQGQREQLLNTINQQSLWMAAGQGKIEETRQMLSRALPEQRVTALIMLAAVLAEKGEKKLALQIIDEARGLFNSQPTNYNELMALLAIARAYGAVEPTRSFEIIEPAIEQLNTLISAAAILDGFDYTRYFKDGEMIPQTNGLLTALAMECVKETATLSKGDFDRAKIAADRFQRIELRVLARLYVAQGVLSNKLPQSTAPASVSNSFLPYVR